MEKVLEMEEEVEIEEVQEEEMEEAVEIEEVVEEVHAVINV